MLAAWIALGKLTASASISPCAEDLNFGEVAVGQVTSRTCTIPSVPPDATKLIISPPYHFSVDKTEIEITGRLPIKINVTLFAEAEGSQPHTLVILVVNGHDKCSWITYDVPLTANVVEASSVASGRPWMMLPSAPQLPEVQARATEKQRVIGDLLNAIRPVVTPKDYEVREKVDRLAADQAKLNQDFEDLNPHASFWSKVNPFSYLPSAKKDPNYTLADMRITSDDESRTAQLVEYESGGQGNVASYAERVNDYAVSDTVDLSPASSPTVGTEVPLKPGPGPYWNSWIALDQQDTEIRDLIAGCGYDFHFDLASQPFAEALPPGQYAQADPSMVGFLDEHAEHGKVFVTAAPFVIGPLSLATPADRDREIPIEISKLNTTRTGATRSLSELSKGSAASITVPIKTALLPGEEGACASVGVSLWNTRGGNNQPLDYVVRHVRIGGTSGKFDADCRAGGVRSTEANFSALRNPSADAGLSYSMLTDLATPSSWRSPM